MAAAVTCAASSPTDGAASRGVRRVDIRLSPPSDAWRATIAAVTVATAAATASTAAAAATSATTAASSAAASSAAATAAGSSSSASSSPEPSSSPAAEARHAPRDAARSRWISALKPSSSSEASAGAGVGAGGASFSPCCSGTPSSLVEAAADAEAETHVDAGAGGATESARALRMLSSRRKLHSDSRTACATWWAQAQRGVGVCPLVGCATWVRYERERVARVEGHLWRALLALRFLLLLRRLFIRVIVIIAALVLLLLVECGARLRLRARLKPPAVTHR